MRKTASIDHFTKPKDFEINEIKVSQANGKNEIDEAGFVQTWKPIALPRETEKARLRPWITGITLFIWVVSIVVGLSRYLATGDATLFIGTNLLLLPICMVLRFYYH